MESTLRETIDCWGYNFQPTSTISMLYERCDVQRSFETLVRSLRPLIWPQRPRKVTDGKEKKITGENLRFVNFWARETCSTSKEFSEHQWFRFEIKLELFFMKILKKIDFSEICLKILVGFWQTRPNFRTAIQDMLKMTVLPLSQHNCRKSEEFWHF